MGFVSVFARGACGLKAWLIWRGRGWSSPGGENGVEAGGCRRGGRSAEGPFDVLDYLRDMVAPPHVIEHEDFMTHSQGWVGLKSISISGICSSLAVVRSSAFRDPTRRNA